MSDDDYVYDEESGEWMPASELAARRAAAAQVEVRDAVGNLLADGDQVTLIKDLEVKGAGQTLKRGTLVGQQTAGGVISTGGTTLIDGTTVRIPYRGWFLPDGTNMENHGATPDVVVTQTPEDESRDYDAQLKAAVDDLMKRVR